MDTQSIWMRDLHTTDTRRVSRRSLNTARGVKSAGFHGQLEAHGQEKSF